MVNLLGFRAEIPTVPLLDAIDMIVPMTSLRRF
jgi:hypothetical protein